MRANGCRKNILSITPHAFRISPCRQRLRWPDPSSDYSYIHLQESKTMRRNPGHSNPLSQHWDHIITTSITHRTVRPWLVMMIISRARVQWHGRIVFIIVSDTSVITSWPATVKLVGDSPVRDNKKRPTGDIKDFREKDLSQTPSRK